MSERGDQTERATEAKDGPSLKRRAVFVCGGVAGLVAVWLLCAAFVPRWWAQRIGNVIDGRLFFGSFLGLVIGAVFVIIPFVVLALGWRFRSGMRRSLMTLALACIAAAPNLATLGIVWGSGSAAHAGGRILDVDGPGFRGGSLVGALIGLAISAMTAYLLIRRGVDKDQKRQLQMELAERSKR